MSRPYTVLLMNPASRKVRATCVLAPYGSSDAKEYLQEKYTKERLLAFMPGTHTGYIEIVNEETRYKSTSIDPFDTPVE